jgi:AraC-like DNA-binding protein
MTRDGKRLTRGASAARRPARVPTSSPRALSALFAELERAGVDARRFARGRGLDWARLDDEAARIPLAQLAGIWDDAAHATGDAHFALHAAAGVQAHSFGLFSYLAATNPTWGASLERARRYFRLLTDGARYDLSTAGGQAVLAFVPTTREIRFSPQLCDFSVAVVFAYGRRYVRAFRVHEVHLPYPAPARPEGHLAFFGAPVRWDTATAALCFAGALLEAPVELADPHLAALLASFAEARLAALSPDDFVGGVRDVIRPALQRGEASLANAARHLGLTPRTLQRRLSSAGTTFHALLDEARRQLALPLVKQQHGLSLHEVAFLTGFSEPAAFHRAFRRWTGVTPAAYRSGRNAASSFPTNNPELENE